MADDAFSRELEMLLALAPSNAETEAILLNRAKKSNGKEELLYRAQEWIE
jgi:hypothetical protein